MLKVLLITDRPVYKEDSNIWCAQDFFQLIKKMSYLGDIYVCCPCRFDRCKSNLISNSLLSDLIPHNHIAPITKSFFAPSSKTKRTICDKIEDVDLVVGYIPSLNAEYSLLYAKKIGKKFLSIMVACPWDGLWNQDWKRKIIAPYRFLLNRYVLYHSDYALYVTNKFLQNRYPTRVKGLNAVGISDVALEENCIDEINFRFSKIDALSKGDEIKLVTTATLDVVYKGQRYVIAALKRLKEMGYDNYHYYLIGGGSNKYLSRIAKKLGVSNQVHFVGKLSHEQVFKCLREMDIYVHPSLQEGLPRSVVEAMSLGLPCIGAMTAAIPELLDYQFVVRRKSVADIVDKILLLDKAMMKKQAERNFLEAKNYSSKFLDERRNRFYEYIINDLANTNVSKL